MEHSAVPVFHRGSIGLARRQRPSPHLRSSRRQHTPFIDSAEFSGDYIYGQKLQAPFLYRRGVVVFPRKQMDPFQREIAPLVQTVSWTMVTMHW